MSPTGRIFAYIHAPRDDHEPILVGTVAPLAREIREAPALEAISFTRAATPDWLIRVLVRGESRWIDGPCGELLRQGLRGLSRVVIVDGRRLPEYEVEARRWGAGAGILLAEAAFHHDSLGCLERMELEARGLSDISRREYSLLMTERLLDLWRLDRGQRLELYRAGFAWTLEQGIWTDAELASLDGRFAALRPSLAARLEASAAGDVAEVWGGEAAADSAERCLRGLASVIEVWIESGDAERGEGERARLAGALAHHHAIRLGVEGVPEAILRYFMYLFHSGGQAARTRDASAGADRSHGSP